MSLLRYRTPDIAAVLEGTEDKQTAAELFGVGGQTPVVSQLADAPHSDSLYVGIAPPGGKLPDEWKPIILEAIAKKMDIVSGLHDFLCDDPEYVAAAAESGSRLIDVRKNTFKSIAQGQPLGSSLRIHTVGRDCSVGKMVVTLELQRALAKRDWKAKFLATGQTGIMITGEGLPIDCVVVDFVNGAAESLVTDCADHDFLLIEGQGSISHPAYSAVTLGLLHGCAPDGLIYCYEAGRKQVKGLQNIDFPEMSAQLNAYRVAAHLRHPCKIIGIAVNTRYLDDGQAAAEIARVEQQFELPACDVYRNGPEKLVNACVQLREEVATK